MRKDIMWPLEVSLGEFDDVPTVDKVRSRYFASRDLLYSLQINVRPIDIERIRPMLDQLSLSGIDFRQLKDLLSAMRTHAFALATSDLKEEWKGYPDAFKSQDGEQERYIRMLEVFGEQDPSFPIITFLLQLPETDTMNRIFDLLKNGNETKFADLVRAMGEDDDLEVAQSASRIRHYVSYLYTKGVIARGVSQKGNPRKQFHYYLKTPATIEDEHLKAMVQNILRIIKL
jgi:hypothetical protein